MVSVTDLDGLERRKAFVASVAEFHGLERLGCAAGDGVSESESRMDVTFGNRRRAHRNPVAARRRKAGQVVSRRFYCAK